MALELVTNQVTVIVANTPGVLALKAAVTTIPIVFTTRCKSVWSAASIDRAAM
jgi:hypothetical protein